MNEQPTTLDYNRLICDLLIAAVERGPEWRFGQIMRNLELIKEIRDSQGMPIGWVDDFSTPSAAMLARAGKYEPLMKELGAFTEGNAKMAARRLKVDRAARRRKRAEKGTP